MSASGDTMLRELRRAGCPQPATSPVVVGIDDWVIARGHRYGTIIVDLELRRPIEAVASAFTTSIRSMWPAFDASALPETERAVFAARRQAIELYAAGRSLSEIETCTGVNRRQLYRLLDHCMAPHDDGRAYGWRAVMRYARVGAYQRTTRLTMSRDTAPAAVPLAPSGCCSRRSPRLTPGSPIACTTSAFQSSSAPPMPDCAHACAA
jgi:hypothetical protein